MKNVIIRGLITATSKKENDKFKQDNPTKTAYITVDAENRKKLLSLGLTEYTSRKDKQGFFIIKFSANTVIYQDRNNNEATPFKLHTMDTPNFKTLAPVEMNVIRGENMGNDFFRIQALLVLNPEVFEKVEASNPFAEQSQETKGQTEPIDINDDNVPF